MKMKSKLIALAVSSAVSVAVVAPAVAGDVTVYGRVQAEITSISYEDELVAGEVDGIDMADNAMGRIGFKASEDLGNGWTGLAKYESKADTVAGGIATGGRESMVGLKGSGVTIELGNLKSAYKYAGGVKYDPFVATALEARGNFGMTGKVGDFLTDIGVTGFGGANKLGHSSFIDNAIGVQGGSGPVKFRLTYGPEENDGRMSASVQYDQGGIQAFLAIVDSGDVLDPAGTTGREYSSTKVGGQYSMGPHKISLQYEMPEAKDNTGTLEWTNLYIDYQMKMGKNTFDVAIGQEDYDACTGTGCTPSFLRIGVIHKMSKMTRVFAGYRSSDSDGIDYREDAISVGLRKDF